MRGYSSVFFKTSTWVKVDEANGFACLDWLTEAEKCPSYVCFPRTILSWKQIVIRH